MARVKVAGFRSRVRQAYLRHIEEEGRMSRTQKVTIFIAAVASVLMVGLAILPYGSHAQTPAPSAAAVRNRGVILDNVRVTVQRITQPAGTIEKPHTHADEDYVTIQLTAGDIEVTVGNETTKGSVGKAWWLPKGTNHAVSNVGTTPVDVIAIRVK
jgi:quercetin dioxygenase-like cupin family protein